MESRVIFINLTKLCNVNCPRCYLTDSSRVDKFRMPIEVLDKVLESKYVQDADEVTFVLQGGEPSILGFDFLSSCVSIIESSHLTHKIAMVSNLLNMPDWLVKFSKEKLKGRLETTYASGYKFTLSGSEESYNSKFIKSLKKAIDAGLPCPINVELNRETYHNGASLLVDIAEQTGARVWEFDFSVDFSLFHKEPGFNQFGYPILNSTLSYDEFYEFVFDFGRLFHERIGGDLSCGVIDQFSEMNKSINFNIQREKDFITVNPDGTITTNPLFSDIVQTYLGNINRSSLDNMINSASRVRRIMHEKNRAMNCFTCKNINRCGGGVSHLPVYDGSENCVGGIKIWEKYE